MIPHVGLIGSPLLAHKPAPLPVLPNAANINYWLDAGRGVYADDQLALATNGGAVGKWKNLGNASDVLPTSPTALPIFKTGGANGKPFVQFANSPLTLPGMGTFFGNINTPWHAYAIVMRNFDNNDYQPIIGSAGRPDGSKAAFAFRPEPGRRVHHHKTDWRFGDIDGTDLTIVIVTYYGPADAAREVNGQYSYGFSTQNADGWYQENYKSFGAFPVDGADRFLNAEVYEFICWWDANLSPEQMTTVYNMLHAKYAPTP